MSGAKEPGRPAGRVRTYQRRLQRKPDEDADDPTYFFTKPRIGYRMAKGKTVEEETACPRRGMRQNVLKTEELSETSSRLGKPICAGRYRRIKVKQGKALQSDWRRGRKVGIK